MWLLLRAFAPATVFPAPRSPWCGTPARVDSAAWVCARSLSAFQSVSTLPEDFTGQNSNARLEITPNGRFVYAANRGHDSIAGFSVDSKTGKLTSIGQFPTEKTPRSFSIDPSGKYLLTAGEGSGKLAMYSIEQETGMLTRIGTYVAGERPWWVLIL